MKHKWHFVYLSFEEDGRNYIGVRSTFDLHDGYLGSYSDRDFNPTCRIILGYYKSREVALRAEIVWQRVFNVVEDSTFANKAYQTSKKFVNLPGYNYDHPGHSQDYKDSRKGSGNPMFGQKQSNSSKSKMAASKRGRKFWYNPDTGEQRLTHEQPGSNWVQQFVNSRWRSV
jgi:hypothetical protein